jgi:hypothetical protein
MNMKSITKLIPTAWVDNKMIATILAMLLAIYAALAAPMLPASVIRFFDQWYGKLLFIFLIAFLSAKNIQIALMVSVVFFIILHYAAQLDVQEHFFGSCNARESYKNKERFEGSMKEDDEEFTDAALSPDVVDALKESGVSIPETKPKAESNPLDILQNTVSSLQKITEMKGDLNTQAKEIQKSLETAPATPAAPAEEAQAIKEKFQTMMDARGLLNVAPYDTSLEAGAPFDM